MTLTRPSFWHLFACATALTLVACSRTAQEYVGDGDRFFTAGRYDDAELKYRKALQKNASSADAYFGLGRTRLKQGKVAEGYRALSNAVQLQPNNRRFIIELSDLCLGICFVAERPPESVYNQLTSLTDTLLAHDSEDFDGLRLKGSIAKLDKHPEEAIRLLQRANAIKPMQKTVLVPLGESLTASGREQDAETILLELISHEPKEGVAYDMLYMHYVKAKRLGDAEALLKRRCAHTIDSIDPFLRLALFYHSQNRLQEMNSTIEGASKNVASVPNGRLRIGEFYSAIGQPDQALQSFQEGLQKESANRTIYLKKIAAVQLGRNQREAALSTVEDILKNEPGDDESRIMQSVLLVARAQASDVAKAIQQLQALAPKYPTNILLRQTLANAHLVNGDIDGAKRQLQELVNIRPDHVDARLGLAELAERIGDYTTTIRFADEVLAIDAANLRAKALRCAALTGTGQLQSARRELGRLVQSDPTAPEVQVQYGLLCLKEGKFTDAERQFNTLLAKDAKNTQALEGLIQSYTAQKRFEPALARLSDLLAKDAKSEVLHRLRASTAKAAGDDSLALREYQWLTTENPQAFMYHIEMAQVYEHRGATADAIAAMEKARALSPKDVRIPVAVAALYEKSGRIAEAHSAYRRALELDPQNVFVLNNLAFFLADRGKDLDDALAFSNRAQKIAPQNAAVLDTIAWIYVQKKMYDAAIPTLNNLTKKYPSDALYRYHIGVALANKGDVRAAREHLQLGLQADPGVPLKSKLLEVLQRIG